MPRTITSGSGIDVTDDGSLITVASRFTQSGTGAVERNTQDKLREYVSVKDFGAVGDGVTDDTAAIQSAISYAQSAGGGSVCIPRGVYRITGTLDITASGIHLIGDGIEATELLFDNGASNCIYARGTDTGAGQMNGFTIKAMTLSHGTKTGGRTIVVAFAYKVLLKNLLLNNCWCGIEGYVTNNLDLYNINIQGVLGGGSAPAYLGPASQAPENCYGVFWHAPSDGSFRSDAIRTINVTVQAINSGADGFLWDGGATTWDAYQCTALSCNYGIRVRNTGVSNANYPQFAEFTNVNTDGAQTQGLRIEGGATFHFQGCNFSNTSGASGQGSADTNAVEVLPDESGSFTRHLKFVNCGFQNCRQDVFKLNARDVQFTNCAFYDGGKATSNTYAGLLIGADSEDVIVNGCQFSQYGANNNFRYGIDVAANSQRVLLDGNFIYNAQTQPIRWLNTDSYSRVYNTADTFALNSDESVFMNPTEVSAASGNVTLTAAQTLCGILIVSGAAVARDVTTATAAAIVAAVRNPFLGSIITLTVINTGSATISIAGGTGVSINGNVTGGKYAIAAGTTREIKLRTNNFASGSESVAAYA
jgi:hypothetical protein